jgi:hypothetical protein
MRTPKLQVALALMGMMACLKPPQAAVAAARPAVELRIEFTDAVAIIGLEALPEPHRWQWMDMGLWSPLTLSVPTPGHAVAKVPRTAPEWLLLKDPSGGVHQMVLGERPDPVPMPMPGRLRESDRLSDEDRSALVVIGMIWVLSFTRR